MLVREFDFNLPEDLIAQQPPVERGGARMLTLDRRTGSLADGHFSDLPGLLRAGDVLVINDSRVLPARLYAERGSRPMPGSQPGRIEVLLTSQSAPGQWKALVRPGRKVLLGERLYFRLPGGGEPLLSAEVIAHAEFGERLLRFDSSPNFYAALDALGHMPLPPYIHRGDEPTDRERYQTVYAAEPGSVAAPTAGLHFTEPLLKVIRTRGVEVVPVTLHVGLGTFQPVRVAQVSEITLHSERYTLAEQTARTINQALREGRRVIAAGTTTVRTLEHCARMTPAGAPLELAAHSGETSIFLSPGAPFLVISALLTNFHLPQSTLLMLVSAFADRDRVMAAYKHAVRERYRFFSYGDCMFIS